MKIATRRSQSLLEIVMKYPYVSLQDRHEQVFREMLLQTQANIQVFEYDKSLYTCLVTYMSGINDVEGLEERNREAQRYLQEVVITSLLTPTDIERLLKIKHDDSKKKARSILTMVDEWIKDIKTALVDRKSKWEQRASSAGVSASLTSADDATAFPQIDLATRMLIAPDVRVMEPIVEVSEVEDVNRSLYPTLNPKVYNDTTRRRLGRLSPLFILLNSQTHSLSLTVLFVFDSIVEAYLADEDNHGKMYPPDEILKEQCEFLRSSACFVQKSSIPSSRFSGRSFRDPGQGAFVGRGIAKGTILFYSGLLYFGDYNEEEMSKLWQTKFNEIIAPEWQNKIFKIDNKHWIIGSQSEWTSNLNSNHVNALCHATIVLGEIAMIQFSQAAFSFDEVMLTYLLRIPLTAYHSPPVVEGQTQRHKLPISAHLTANTMSSTNREVQRLKDSLIGLTEPAQSAEETHIWAIEKESKAGGSKKRKNSCIRIS